MTDSPGSTRPASALTNGFMAQEDDFFQDVVSISYRDAVAGRPTPLYRAAGTAIAQESSGEKLDLQA